MPKLEIIPEEIEINGKKDCCILNVKGFVDAPNYEMFTKSLSKVVQNGCLYLVLDFSSVMYINSTGISALIKWQGTLSDKGGALILAHVPRSVAVSLDLLGLTTVVPLVKNQNQAWDLVAKIQSGQVPAGGLDRAAEIKGFSRKIPVWPQKPLKAGQSSVMIVLPRSGHFTDVLKLRMKKSNASFHVFHRIEDAFKAYDKISPEVVILDDRVDPNSVFIAKIKLDKGKSLTSFIKIYPKGINVQQKSGFRIWENDYLTDPFELLELFSLAETELRRVPKDRKFAQQEVRFAFRSTPKRIEKANELMFKLLSQSGLDAKSLDLFFKAFKEAVDNAVRHGNNLKAEKVVDVIYLLERQNVKIQVADQGKGFDYEFYLAWSLKPHAFEEAKQKIIKEGRKGGLGILYMRRCTDKLEYRGAGNIVCLEKKIP